MYEHMKIIVLPDYVQKPSCLSVLCLSVHFSCNEKINLTRKYIREIWKKYDWTKGFYSFIKILFIHSLVYLIILKLAFSM